MSNKKTTTDVVETSASKVVKPAVKKAVAPAVVKKAPVVRPDFKTLQEAKDWLLKQSEK